MSERGKVLWYSAEKGFGFIEPDLGGKDIFVRRTAVRRAGLQELHQADIVSFEIETRDGKSRAGSIELIATSAGAAVVVSGGYAHG